MTDRQLLCDDLGSIPAKHFTGLGLEIGALANAFKVGPGTQMHYADVQTREKLVEGYGRIKNFPTGRIVHVDFIIAPDGTITTPYRYDFLIANHVLEHTVNVSRALNEWMSRVMPGGRALVVVPRKSTCFDKDRPTTEPDHFALEAALDSRLAPIEHYLEWARFVDKVPEAEIGARANAAWKAQANIHFHTWELDTWVESLERLSEGRGWYPEETRLCCGCHLAAILRRL